MGIGDFFSEAVAAYVIKVGRCIKLNEATEV